MKDDIYAREERARKKIPILSTRIAPEGAGKNFQSGKKTHRSRISFKKNRSRE